MKPVAICKNLLSQHRTNFSEMEGWEEWLTSHHIPWEYVDCYKYDIIEKLSDYSALLWHYSNFVNADLMEAQYILDIAESKGLFVYPNHSTGWHFDDKIAEMYALQSVGAPIPASWVFYEKDKCEKWLEEDAKYPIVAKLRRGSGANNVKLLKNKEEAKKYARRMFGRGISPAQSLVYKTYSKVQSTHDWKTFVRRFKQIPNFLWARRFGKGMPIEKGYCYFQEFIPNAGFDLKVAVVNNKCCAVHRSVRKGDFRASGGGNTTFKKSVVTDQIITSAMKAAEDLKLQTIGFDYVVDERTGTGKIIEMCFGNGVAEETYAAGGYWDRDLVWHDEPLNVVTEILETLVEECSDQK